MWKFAEQQQVGVEQAQVDRFRVKDSVGGTPTGATGTVALPKKMERFRVEESVGGTPTGATGTVALPGGLLARARFR